MHRKVNYQVWLMVFCVPTKPAFTRQCELRKRVPKILMKTVKLLQNRTEMLHLPDAKWHKILRQGASILFKSNVYSLVKENILNCRSGTNFPKRCSPDLRFVSISHQNFIFVTVMSTVPYLEKGHWGASPRRKILWGNIFRKKIRLFWIFFFLDSKIFCKAQ